MTRNDKVKAKQDLVPGADGYTKVRFAHPELIKAARAERGHDRMTPAEVAARRLGRGAMSPTKIEDTRRQRAEMRRMQRTLGGRRITGRHPGTKHPQSWHRTGR
jgi:hypothetical protein